MNCEDVRVEDVPGVCVEQGPAWLVEWTVEPPAWLYGATVGGVLALLVLLGYAAWRVDVDEDVIEETCETVLIVGCIASATWVVVSTGRFGYVTDVLLGTGSGYCTALAIRVGAQAGVRRLGQPQ